MDDGTFPSRMPSRSLRSSNIGYSRYKNKKGIYYPQQDDVDYGDSHVMTGFWVIAIAVIVVVIIIVLCILFRPKAATWTTPSNKNNIKTNVGGNCSSNSDCQQGLICFQDKCATNIAVQQTLNNRSMKENLKRPLKQPSSIPIPPITTSIVKPSKPRFDIGTSDDIPTMVQSFQPSAVAGAGFYG
jgi:hypothetical protein